MNKKKKTTNLFCAWMSSRINWRQRVYFMEENCKKFAINWWLKLLQQGQMSQGFLPRSRGLLSLLLTFTTIWHKMKKPTLNNSQLLFWNSLISQRKNFRKGPEKPRTSTSRFCWLPLWMKISLPHRIFITKILVVWLTFSTPTQSKK